MEDDIATIGDVITYLETNFKPDDKLCYMDCVEGLKNDCTYITYDQLGDRFFKYVNKLKSDNLYPYVDDNDVIVI